MEAISLDLRLSILRDCESGQQTREMTAETFGVSRSFVQKLLQRHRQSQTIRPRPRTGGPSAALDSAARVQLRALVKARPDATLAELAAALHAAGTPAVSEPTVCRALQQLGLPLKKSPCTPANGEGQALSGVTRRGCGRCGAGGGIGPARPTPDRSYSSMKAGPTPPWSVITAEALWVSGWSGRCRSAAGRP